MRNNNRGFTLIELLSVVVILLVISVVAISSISSAIERNNAKQNNSKIEAIESAASRYYSEHKNSIKVNDKIRLNVLELSDSELQYADGSQICGYVKVNSGPEFKFEKDSSWC